MAIGVVSALKPRLALRPLRDGRRARGRVAADLLHRPDLAGIFSYQLGWIAPARPYTPFTENPPAWAHALILPWITLRPPVLRAYARLTRAGMLETMGEDYIRTARAKGLPERTVVASTGSAPR